MIIRLTSQFQDTDGGAYTLSVWRDTDTDPMAGLASRFITMSDIQATDEYDYDIVLAESSVIMETDRRDDFTEPLMPTRLQFTMLTDIMPSFLYSTDPTAVRVSLRKGSGVVYAGWVMAASLSQSFHGDCDTLDVQCVDLVGISKYIRYENAYGAVPYEHSIYDYLQRYFNAVNNNDALSGAYYVDNTFLTPSGGDVITDICIDEYRYTNGEDCTWSDVLTDILRWLNLIAVCRCGSLYMYSYADTVHRMTEHRFTGLDTDTVIAGSFGTICAQNIMGGDTTVTVENGARKVTVTSHPETFEPYEVGSRFEPVAKVKRGWITNLLVTPDNHWMYTYEFGSDEESANITYHLDNRDPDEYSCYSESGVIGSVIHSYDSEVAALTKPSGVLSPINITNFYNMKRGAVPLRYSRSKSIPKSSDRHFYIDVIDNFITGMGTQFPYRDTRMFDYRHAVDKSMKIGRGYIAIGFELMFCDLTQNSYADAVTDGNSRMQPSCKVLPVTETDYTYPDFTDNTGRSQSDGSASRPLIYVQLRCGDMYYDSFYGEWTDKPAVIRMYLDSDDRREESSSSQSYPDGFYFPHTYYRWFHPHCEIDGYEGDDYLVDIEGEQLDGQVEVSFYGIEPGPAMGMGSSKSIGHYLIKDLSLRFINLDDSMEEKDPSDTVFETVLEGNNRPDADSISIVTGLHTYVMSDGCVMHNSPIYYDSGTGLYANATHLLQGGVSVVPESILNGAITTQNSKPQTRIEADIRNDFGEMHPLMLYAYPTAFPDEYMMVTGERINIMDGTSRLSLLVRSF